MGNLVKKATKDGRLDSQAQLALIKQILYDDEELKTLLSKSDSTLRLVRDLLVDERNNNPSAAASVAVTANVDDNNHHIDDDVRSIASTNMVSILQRFPFFIRHQDIFLLLFSFFSKEIGKNKFHSCSKHHKSKRVYIYTRLSNF